MTATETRAVLVALRTTDHTYIAVRPMDSTPPEAPGFLLSDHTANDLQDALYAAEARWPDCTMWELIGSDQMLLVRPDLPPDLRSFRQPVVIATFGGHQPEK